MGLSRKHHRECTTRRLARKALPDQELFSCDDVRMESVALGFEITFALWNCALMLHVGQWFSSGVILNSRSARLGADSSLCRETQSADQVNWHTGCRAMSNSAESSNHRFKMFIQPWIIQACLFIISGTEFCAQPRLGAQDFQYVDHLLHGWRLGSVFYRAHIPDTLNDRMLDDNLKQNVRSGFVQM